MSDHRENVKVLTSYLSYLRDVSRKIASKAGFEKCLLNKTTGYAQQINYFADRYTDKDRLYPYLCACADFLTKNYDKKLFLGLGLVAGTDKRILAAPLLTLQCELAIENNAARLDPDVSTLNLNYDLISALSSSVASSSVVDDDDEVFNDVFTDDENETFADIEDELVVTQIFDFSELVDFTRNIFNLFVKNIACFRNISEAIHSDYNFSAEMHRFLEKQTKEQSIFAQKLIFINASHLFVNTVPDQLSTYEALNNFVGGIGTDFQNPVVEKLLANALTNERQEIKCENNNEQIQKVIDDFIPLSLSKAQIQALKNAWNNEISYVQGPPGTGKSHTISAIVLSALGLNKKVLVVAQKTAALKVIYEKINPLLSDTTDEEFVGVFYYEQKRRDDIRNYLKYLLTTDSNANNINTLKQNLDKWENSLTVKFTELRQAEQELTKALDYQHEHHEKHAEFIKQRDRFRNDFVKIPVGFSFTKIEDAQKSKYDQHLAFISEIYQQNYNLLTNLHRHKFKQHLQEHFNTPKEWLTDATLPEFSRAFIQLNNAFTAAKKINSALRIDTENIRKRISYLKKDIAEIQRKLLITQHKYHVFSHLRDHSCRQEIDKFAAMLRFANSRLISEKMRDINFAKITDIFPLWVGEIRNLGHIFPLQAGMFDLIVVDEASQVNLAEILPAFYRAKRICIVGDHKQLNLKATGLSFSVSRKFDELVWEKYNTLTYQAANKRNLTVTQASILDFFRSPEYQVSISEVMLDEHFRSLPHLAKYTSRWFYGNDKNPEGNLKIMTETPDKLSIKCFKTIPCPNGRREKNKKIIEDEVEVVLQIIADLISPTAQSKYCLPEHINGKKFTIGVISMIRDQCERIKEKISERFSDGLAEYGIDVGVSDGGGIGTPEEFQGNERDIMIFTFCLDENSKGFGHFQDDKRLNVATSRAKLFTYVVYSPFPPTFNKIHRYLNYIDGNIVDDGGNPAPFAPHLPPLNYDKFESEFERQVYLILDKFVKNHANGQNLSLHNQINSCGRRLDFVIYNHQTKKSAAIEVDGRQHFATGALTENYTVEHIERIDILTRAGWNIINTPYYKWYADGWLRDENDARL
ncbi:MAG: hypothetical protein LBP75_02745 [Planctomycetota bacterium]|jgi:signal recognition particle GTPase|nr:hypothetical protein [Planctomycetota bacterium]